MRANLTLGVTLIAWIVLSPPVTFGQTAGTQGSGTKKPPAATDQTAELTRQAQDYQTLLQNPAVASTCRLEVLSMPASLTQDARFVDGLFAACATRLQNQALASSGAPAAPTAPPAAPTAPPAAPTVPPVAPTVPPVAPTAPPAAQPAAQTAQCPNPVINTNLKQPTLDPVNLDENPDSVVVTGKVQLPEGSTGKVQLCFNGKPLGDAAPVTGGAFNVSLSQTSSTTKLKVGEQIQAQLVDVSPNEDFGPTSSPPLKVGSCSGAVPPGDKGTAPTLTVSIADTNQLTFSGTVKGATKGAVRICVGDVPKEGATAQINEDGTYKGGEPTVAVNAGDSITAQQCSNTENSCSGAYGPVSNPAVPVSNGPLIVGGTPGTNNGPKVIIIGGAEYAGYSSQAQSTDFFLNIFYQGPVTHGFSGWTRIRLTNAPQPATNSVVSVVSNPTGLTTNNYANVGQVFDYVFGPSLKVGNNWALIADAGAITPLSSQSSPLTFTAPGAGTQECTTLLKRFPVLPPNTATPTTSCLASPYAYIAFANQDRSSFLLKYGGGVRTWYEFGGCKAGSSSGKCSAAYAAVDATFGQDASVTGGALHGAVFKLDGILPIPTGSSSWLYLFGSTYLRLQPNRNLSPLLLQAPNPPVTVPAPNVFVLPLMQPNRDYYRLGVGVNINQLWCKTFGTGCTATTPSTGSTATTSSTGSTATTPSTGSTATTPSTKKAP